MIDRYMTKGATKVVNKAERVELKPKRPSPRSNSLSVQAKVVKLKKYRGRSAKAKKGTAYDQFS